MRDCHPPYKSENGVLSVDGGYLLGPITAECYQELFMNVIFLSEVEEHECWCQQGRVTAHTANSTVLFSASALFVETCGPLDPRLYCHRISIFGGFSRRPNTKTTCTHEKK
jgi:hypothetical protein